MFFLLVLVVFSGSSLEVRPPTDLAPFGLGSIVE